MTTLPGARNRGPFWPVLFTAVLFLLAAPVYWRAVERPEHGAREALENADLYQRVLPVFQYGFGRLRQGQLPLWTDAQFCGAPFLANPATGLFHPFNVVFLLLPTPTAMAWHAALCLALMGLGCALFARSLGLRDMSALFTGVTYAFSGAAAAAMSRPELANAMACAPWLFWAVTVFPPRSNAASAAVPGITLALLFLCGSPAAAIAFLLLTAPYAVLLAFGGSAKASAVSRALLRLALGAAVAFGLAAVQWAPTLGWLAGLDAPLQTLTHVDLAGQAPGGLAALLAQTVSAAPDYLPRRGYFGMAALLVLPAAFFHPGARTGTVYFSIAAALCLAAAATGQTALRACFLPLAFSVSVLAGIGVDALFSVGRDMRSPRFWGPIAAAAALIIGLVVIGTPPAVGRVALLTLVLVALLAAPRARTLVAGLTAFLSLVQAVDLAAANGNRFTHPFGTPPHETLPDTLAVVRAAAPEARIHVATSPIDTALSPNAGFLADAPLAGGVFWPLTREQARWWRGLAAVAETGPRSRLGIAPDAAYPDAVNLMAVGSLAVAADSPFTESPWPEGTVRLGPPVRVNDHVVFQNDSALPRAFWVPAYRAAPNFDAALAALADPQFDPRAACVIEGIMPQTAPPAAPSETLVPCAVETITPEHVVVHVDAPADGILVLADSFAPGWRAVRDGEPQPILRANGLFRGAAVPAGQHRVVFTYEPRSVTVGLTISFLMLAGLIVAGVAAFLRRVRAR